MIKLEMHKVSSNQERDTNIEKVQSASKKRMEIESGIKTKNHQEKICERDPEDFHLWTNLAVAIIDVTATQLGPG